MDVSLRYREEHFTPAEAATTTGLSLTLQRDWRSLGHLRPRTSGRASFSPRELAEVRMMVRLRELGMTLSASREAADQAAPSIVFLALADHPAKALAVDAPPEQAAAYVGMLEKETDEGYLCTLAELPTIKDLRRHAILENGRYLMVRKIDEDVISEDVEAAAVINLSAVARAIVEAAPRPLFTLVVPRSLRSD